jgi:arsenate reductase
MEVADLVNQEHPSYASNFEHYDFSTNAWIKMIQHNPEILKQPIALRGDSTILVETPTDIIKI